MSLVAQLKGLLDENLAQALTEGKTERGAMSSAKQAEVSLKVFKHL